MQGESIYNILVVEDEKIIREGIAGSLKDFAEFVVYTAENGKKGTEILDREKIHGVILDIKMPRMDGLELLEWIRDRNLGAAIFILSGYDDFEYVQRALKAGADDYLLKPATPEKVREISERLREKILEKEKVFADWREMEKRVEESKKILKNRFFIDFIESLPDEQTWKEQTEYLQLHCADLSKTYTAAVLEIDREEIRRKYSKREQVYQVMIQKIETAIEVKCRECGIDFFHPRGALFALFLPGGGFTEPAEMIETMREELENLFGVHCTAGVGKGETGIEGIRKSYLQAEYALQYQVVLGKYEVYRFEELNPEMTKRASGMDSGRFELAVQSGQIEEAKRMISHTIDAYRDATHEGTLYPLYAESMKYLSAVLGVLAGIGKVPERSEGELKLGSPRLVVGKLFEQDTIEKIRDYLELLTEQTAALAAGEKKQKHGFVVEEIKKAIHDGFAGVMDNRKLAEDLKMSSNYIGQVFKKETGKTIKEYLTAVRIEAAKKLLKNSRLMIYEIAFQTGFKDEHYFSSVFKGETGMSPSEYRDL